MLSAFQDFYEHKLDLSGINFGVITLLPKGVHADKIQKFIPICPLRVLQLICYDLG